MAETPNPGEASHTRFVVEAGPFLEAVAKKSARRGRAP